MLAGLADARDRRVPAARQFGEDGRRIALGGRRLAGGQADLALRHGEAGDAVHQAQHVLVLVAEVLGDRHGHIGGLAPHQRRLVGGGDDDDAARQALSPRVSSMNSWTSRPRSPIRPMTIDVAADV